MPPQPRIAFVTYAMHCGGMEAYLLRLGSYLHRQGCEVEIITTTVPGEWFGRIAELQLKARHVPGYGRSGALDPWTHSIRVGSVLDAGGYDVIFLNHSPYAQATLARLPEHVVAIPILHNDAEAIYKVGCGNPSAWNAAVAVSPKVAARARPRVPGRPVLEITSGVELPAAEQWHQRAPFGRPLKLIYLGRLDHAQKGVLWLPDILRATLHRGVEATLTIVGDGPDAVELDQKLLRYGLQNTTRRLRGLTPEQVYGLLLQSHILLMPSYYEGLPIALLESLACGCVPVATRLSGITDVAVDPGETGILVEVEHVDGYADAITTLYNDPAQWARMSHAAHERAIRSFSVESMGRAYLNLITEALDGRYPLPRPRKDQRSLDLGVFCWRDFLPRPIRQFGRMGRDWVRNRFPAELRTKRRG